MNEDDSMIIGSISQLTPPRPVGAGDGNTYVINIPAMEAEITRLRAALAAAELEIESVRGTLESQLARNRELVQQLVTARRDVMLECIKLVCPQCAAGLRPDRDFACVAGPIHRALAAGEAGHD